MKNFQKENNFKTFSIQEFLQIQRVQGHHVLYVPIRAMRKKVRKKRKRKTITRKKKKYIAKRVKILEKKNRPN
jgi:hypothetical protein